MEIVFEREETPGNMTIVGIQLVGDLPLAREDVARQAEGDWPLVRLVMPCGVEESYHTVDDIPLEDTKCPCGHPAHWLIRTIPG